MMLRHGFRFLPNLGRGQMRALIGHIKNMNEENMRVKALEMSQKPVIEKTDRVFKPTHTVEFNREGEALIYSADPLGKETVYFKYPYIFCTPA